jgi:5-methylcytosine-specific restriction enzyme B
MARETSEKNLGPVLQAADHWIKTCLIEDGSVFLSEERWRLENFESAFTAFVMHGLEGSEAFMTKLKIQLQNSSPEEIQLFAEMHWALLLFVSKSVSPGKKRSLISDIWGWSGTAFPTNHPMMADDVLAGIGSAGMAFNNLRWKELRYLIEFARELKKLSFADRASTMTDYDKFVAFAERATTDNKRQFRHMLRYFAFPDRVERIASNNDRRRILVEFGRVQSRELKTWSDRKMDSALLELRQDLQKKYPEERKMDFYQAPLREQWDPEEETDDDDSESDSEGTRTSKVTEPITAWPAGPTNLILYGPPGTGKTYGIRETMKQYTDSGANGREVQRFRVVTFHPSYGYEDFVRGIRPVSNTESEASQFRMVDGVFKQICDRAKADPSHRYAIFIDEINRANIAKVFGELITLIEEDKRAEYDHKGRLVGGMELDLAGNAPGDNMRFGVPKNLDIYGTMNTADRSIALLDIALRRRFEFRELQPEYDLLNDEIEGVDLARLLRRINERLEFYLDREHRIGHAYLLNAKSLAELRRTFRLKIIPLLQEYFFDDLARVKSVLSIGNSGSPFIQARALTHSGLFHSTGSGETERQTYMVTSEENWTADAFRGIYLGTNMES